MSTKFNPLAKKGFDKIGMSEAEVSAAHLKLDQTTPQTIANGIPLLTGLTPTTDYQIATKKYIDDLVSGLGGGHDAVTLDANADTILSLSTQELGIDAQTANRIWAGPVSGVAAVPTFRALVADDIPDLSGTYLTAESDPDFTAWLLATPPLYPGGWYDADQNTINLSGFNNDSGFITSYTDEKVKYDAGDATAGYIADKIIAGTGIGVAEGAGVNENKLVVSSTITQYTDALAVTAIKADAAWKATDWDTAYGWGNHALVGYVTGTPWTSEGYLTEETDPIFSAWDKSTGISITESQISDFGTYLTDITGESIGDLSDVDLTGIAEGKVLKANADGDWVIGTDNDTTYSSGDFDHNSLTNTHNLTTDIDHDALTNFVANEHIDWTADQGATDIHPGNIPDLSGTYMAVGTGLSYDYLQFTRIETGIYLKHLSDPALLLSFITPTDAGTEVDQSGIGNTATYYDSSNWDSSNLENIGLVHSLSFNGSSELIVINDSNNLSFGDSSSDVSFSIGFWFNFTQPSAIKTIIAKYDQTTASPQTEWWLRSQANNTLMFLASDNSEAVTPYRLTNSAPSSGWHFVVVVYNSSGGSGATFANGVTFYIDGISVASTAGNNANYVAMENLTAPVTIGANKNTAGNYTYFSPFDLGRLFIERSALSATIIWQMYQETRGFYNI